MLQALNEDGELIIPSTLTKQEICHLRTQKFFCPQCKERLIIRAGPKVIPHFSHLPKSTCRIGKGGESNYHKQAKWLLYQWLQARLKAKIHLELYLPTIQQRPDILIECNDKRIAVEFQSATVSPQEIMKRNKGYRKENIYPLWILGANLFTPSKSSPYTFKLNHFTQYFINDYGNKTSLNLIFLCPIRQHFIILQDIYFFRPNQAIAHETTIHMKDGLWHELFPCYHLPKQLLFNKWIDVKERFRLANYRFRGRELQFRKWLYKQRLHVEQLPSTIYLPNRLQYQMNDPLWHWQSKLVISLLHPLSIGSTITHTDCNQVIKQSMKDTLMTYPYELLDEYFNYLIKVGLFKKISKYKWQKIRPFRFHRYIEDSLRADRLLMKHLIQS